MTSKSFSAAISRFAGIMLNYSLIVTMVIFNPWNLTSDVVFPAIGMLTAVKSSCVARIRQVIQDFSEGVTTTERLQVLQKRTPWMIFECRFCILDITVSTNLQQLIGCRVLRRGLRGYGKVFFVELS